jgi:hypothetical protein
VTSHLPPPPRAGAGGGLQEAVRSPHLAPRHLTSPICGVAGEPATPARIQLSHPRSYNPPRAHTWASVVRGEGMCPVENPHPLQQPAVTAADFSALYDRSSASGLKPRVVFSHAAGHQMLSIICTFPAPAEITAAAGTRRRRHRRRRRCGRAATAAPGVPDWAASPTAAPTAGPRPHQATLGQSPENAPPALKKLRKRRNEAELLWDCDDYI